MANLAPIQTLRNAWQSAKKIRNPLWLLMIAAGLLAFVIFQLLAQLHFFNVPAMNGNPAIIVPWWKASLVTPLILSATTSIIFVGLEWYCLQHLRNLAPKRNALFVGFHCFVPMVVVLFIQSLLINLNHLLPQDVMLGQIETTALYILSVFFTITTLIAPLLVLDRGMNAFVALCHSITVLSKQLWRVILLLLCLYLPISILVILLLLLANVSTVAMIAAVVIGLAVLYIFLPYMLMALANLYHVIIDQPNHIE